MGGQERLIDDDDLFVEKIIVSYYGGRGGIDWTRRAFPSPRGKYASGQESLVGLAAALDVWAIKYI